MKILIRNKNISGIAIFCVIMSLGSFVKISAQTIIVSSPNGGENWEANSIQTISWTGAESITNVKIEYSLSQGITWHEIISSVDASLEQYSWKVPNIQISDVLIRISDASNSSISDVSDKAFSVFKSEINKSQGMQKNTIATSGTTIKIMPLGDSITEGVADPLEAGYRSKLFDLLYSAGYNFDFVGNQSSGTSSTSNPNFDPDHEGRPGWFAGPPSPDIYGNHNIADSLYKFLNSNPPDIILLHIGTNDISETASSYIKTATQVADQVNSLLNIIYNFTSDPNHNIVIFLAQVIDNIDDRGVTPPPDWSAIIHSRTVEFNNLLVNNIVPNQPIDQKIVLVNMYTALGENYNETEHDDNFEEDGVHPSPQGYGLMADEWFAKIQEYFQPILDLPIDDAINRPVDINLTWTAPLAATDMISHSETFNYQLQVATNPDFSALNLVYEDLNISSATTSIQPTGLEYGTEYFWRVRITNYGWSEVWNFTTEPLLVSAKVFLQGPYNAGTMSTSLNTGDQLETYAYNQPYNVPPWSYSGTETVGGPGTTFFNDNPDIVDWVLVELRTSTSPSPSDVRRAAFVKNNGDIVDIDGTSPAEFSGISGGDYYIVIKHRNHLAVMSANAVTLPNVSAYDFTDAQNKAYKPTVGSPDPMADLGGTKYGMYSGDANADGSPDAFDNNLYWMPANGLPYNYPGGADYNLDGGVDSFDSNLFWKPNNGKATQVPY